jgi:hypothetical protein
MHMKPDATVRPTPLPTSDRRTRSLTELAVEQGIAGPQDFDALLGAGADLWDDDADFEAFLSGIHESRRPEE